MAKSRRKKRRSDPYAARLRREVLSNKAAGLPIVAAKGTKLARLALRHKAKRVPLQEIIKRNGKRTRAHLINIGYPDYNKHLRRAARTLSAAVRKHQRVYALFTWIFYGSDGVSSEGGSPQPTEAGQSPQYASSEYHLLGELYPVDLFVTKIRNKIQDGFAVLSIGWTFE